MSELILVFATMFLVVVAVVANFIPVVLLVLVFKWLAGNNYKDGDK